MRRPTGPGRINDNLNVPPQLRQGLFGLLFNFDIDDATVKQEHRDWLLRNAIPLATADSAQVFLKGSSSRSGDNDYNLALSDRRVHAVRDFLRQNGVPQDRFHLTWVGEEDAALSQADGTENERDRAVSIAIRLPGRRGVTKFERKNPADIEDGFDAERMPQWLMVPALGQRRELVLVHGQGVRLTTSNPKVVQFVDPATGKPVDVLVPTRDRQVITFQGNAQGQAFIFGTDMATGASVPLLDVNALFPTIVRMASWLVLDVDRRTAARNAANVKSLVDEAAKVFLKQANIILAHSGAQPLDFDPVRLSDRVGPQIDRVAPITPRTAGGDTFPVITRRGDGGMRINTYYVWEWEDVNGRRSDQVDAEVDAIPGKHIIYEDRTAPLNARDEGLSLAHEIGHCLGLEHTGTTNNDLRPRLMWNFTNDRRGLLTREEILLAHRLVN